MFPKFNRENWFPIEIDLSVHIIYSTYLIYYSSLMFVFVCLHWWMKESCLFKHARYACHFCCGCVQWFGFASWQASTCLLCDWMFSLVRTHPWNIYFSVSRLKYNPGAVPYQESTTILHSFTNITTSHAPRRHTRSCRWGRGWRLKIKHLVFIMRREMESGREGKDERAR